MNIIIKAESKRSKQS